MADAPIGIFDSGFGGLTVARSVIDQLPHESVLYLGDTARQPYGPKPIGEVREYALDCLDHLVDLTGHAFSWPAIHRRFRANRTAVPKWLNVVRAISSEGFGRLGHHTAVRRLLAGDRSVRRFFEGESDALPRFYEEQIRRDLGPLWDTLPPGALAHDQNAYLKAHGARMAHRVA